MKTHIDSCLRNNSAASNFRKELRGYCVAILVALIGLMAAAKWNLL